MYNNIGLLTPRGTGTSGHVTKNNFGLGGPRNDILGKPSKVPNILSNEELKRKSDVELLDHNKRRKIESEVLTLQDDLEDQGLPADEIELRCQELRAQLISKGDTDQDMDALRNRSLTEAGRYVHERNLAQAAGAERFKNALGISDNPNFTIKPPKPADTFPDDDLTKGRNGLGPGQTKSGSDGSSSSSSSSGSDETSSDESSSGSSDSESSGSESSDSRDKKRRDKRKESSKRSKGQTQVHIRKGIVHQSKEKGPQVGSQREANGKYDDGKRQDDRDKPARLQQLSPVSRDARQKRDLKSRDDPHSDDGRADKRAGGRARDANGMDFEERDTNPRGRVDEDRQLYVSNRSRKDKEKHVSSPRYQSPGDERHARGDRGRRHERGRAENGGDRNLIDVKRSSRGDVHEERTRANTTHRHDHSTTPREDAQRSKEREPRGRRHDTPQDSDSDEQKVAAEKLRRKARHDTQSDDNADDPKAQAHDSIVKRKTHYRGGSPKEGVSTPSSPDAKSSQPALRSEKDSESDKPEEESDIEPEELEALHRQANEVRRGLAKAQAQKKLEEEKGKEDSELSDRWQPDDDDIMLTEFVQHEAGKVAGRNKDDNSDDGDGDGDGDGRRGRSGRDFRDEEEGGRKLRYSQRQDDVRYDRHEDKDLKGRHDRRGDQDARRYNQRSDSRRQDDRQYSDEGRRSGRGMDRRDTAYDWRRESRDNRYRDSRQFDRHRRGDDYGRHVKPWEKRGRDDYARDRYGDRRGREGDREARVHRDDRSGRRGGNSYVDYKKRGEDRGRDRLERVRDDEQYKRSVRDRDRDREEDRREKSEGRRSGRSRQGKKTVRGKRGGSSSGGGDSSSGGSGSSSSGSGSSSGSSSGSGRESSSSGSDSE